MDADQRTHPRRTFHRAAVVVGALSAGVCWYLPRLLADGCRPVRIEP
ncbi:hypothetical protein [Streptomyces platensis]